MQFRKTQFHVFIIGATMLVAALPSRAAVIQFTDSNAFLAALSSSSTDNYANLPPNLYASPLARSIPGYSYNVSTSTSGSILAFPVNGSQTVSTASPSVVLTLNFTAGAPTAVGGYFFNQDTNGTPSNGVITVTANPGASTQSVVTGSATNFFGWLDDSGTPFTSLVIQSASGQFATVGEVVLGQAGAAPASVPGPLPLMGAASAFGFSRRLRSRIAAARPGA